MEPVLHSFHDWYLNRGRCWKRSTWRGVPIWKSAADLLLYQQVICERQPNVIFEIGSAAGGSAMFFADMMQIAGEKPNVVSIDIATNLHPSAVNMEGVLFVLSSSTDTDTLSSAFATIDQMRSVKHPRAMVVLDGDHSTNHVLHELDLWSDVVTAGQFLVVEDGNHDLFGDRPGDNPAEAVRRFMANGGNERFELVAEMDTRYGMSFAHGGWLLKS